VNANKSAKSAYQAKSA